MKASAWLFWGLAGFFLLQSVGYGLWTIVAQGSLEWTGTVALAVCFVFGALLAFYLTVTRSRARDLPEDNPNAGIDEADGELGHFSPWSWWPFIVASACFLVFLGFVIGIWMVMIGSSLLAVSLVGWVYEYYRGFFAR